MKTVKEAVDILCQPKVMASISIAALIISGFLHNMDLAVIAVITLLSSAIWAWVESPTA